MRYYCPYSKREISCRYVIVYFNGMSILKLLNYERTLPNLTRSLPKRTQFPTTR